MSAARSRAPARRLFRAVAKKQALLLIRYPVNTFSRIVTIYMLFAVVFFGGRAVAGPALADSLGGIVVGFFLFTMAIVAYAGLAWDVTREAQWGTLEQLYMSPYGFGRVMVVKIAVNVLFSFLWGAVVLALMIATTGRVPEIAPLTVVAIVVPTLASVTGIGFVFGGLALLYKRIENAFQLVQFAFIGLIAAPVGEYPWLRYLPIAQGSHLLQRAMRDGVRIWEMAPAELAILVGTGLAYFAAGYYVFQRAQRRARRKGLMGQY